MRRIFKRLFIVLLVSILLLTVELFFLISTQSGLRLLTSFAPDSIKIGHVDGTLGDFSLEKLEVSFDGGRLEVEKLKLQWGIRTLISRSFSIDNVSLTSVNLTFLESTVASPEPYQPWVGLSLPIDIEINKAQVSDLSINQNNQQLFHLDKAQSTIKVIADVVSIKQLSFYEQGNSLDLSGQVDIANVNTGKVDIKNKIDWRVGEEHISFNGRVTGTWRELVLSQLVASPLNAQLTATLNNIHSDRIAWNAKIKTFESIKRNELANNIEIQPSEINSRGDFSPSQGFDALSTNLSGQLNFSYAEKFTWLADLDLNFSNGDLAVNALELIEQDSSDQTNKNSGELSLSGVIENVSEFIDRDSSLGIADLTGNWSNVVVPLELDDSNSADELTITSNGRFDLSGLSSDFRINSLADGVISGARPIDTSFSSELTLAIVGKSFVIDKAQLLSGATTVNIAGSVDTNYDLTWNIDSPNIADLLPSATGELFSSGTLLGTKQQPKIRFEARSNQLSFNDYQLQGLAIKGNALLFNQDAPLSANISLKSFAVKNDALAQALSIDLSGSLAKHQLSINSLLKETTSLSVDLSGSVAPNANEFSWQGLVTQLSAKNSKLGNWALSDDMQIDIVGSQLKVTSSCLMNAEQSICLDAAINTDKQTANLQVTSLAMAQLRPLLADYGLSLDGVIDGRLSYAKTSDIAAAKIDGFIESRNGKIFWQELNLDTLETKELGIQTLRFDVEQITKPIVKGLVKLDDGSQLVAIADLSEAVDSIKLESANIAGRLVLDINDLATLPPSLIADLPVNGNLNAQIELTGTVLKPQVTLSAKIKNASAEVPELGLALKNIELVATTSDGSIVTLNGKLQSGEGWLDINGSLNLANITEPVILIDLVGNSLTLANTGELDIVGSVNLNTRIDNERLDLNGSIKLDSAIVDFKVPETAVLASDDVILLGNDKVQKAIKQSIDLNIDLGKKARISAQGLDAKLEGRLRVTQKPEGIVRGEGQIDVLNGRYVAYGQDLKIDKGRLVFNGGSIEDPSLELRAQKTADNVTAGVKVSGRASAPILGLYSTPSMSDQDILSVLVFNKRLGELGSQDGLVLLQIANSLRGDGQSNVSKITQGIQNKLGLTDLQVNLGSNAPSIQAGKQLSSKFYVGYGYSLLSAAQTLILRYKLNKAWSIKADVGADSGADLRYQIER